MPKQSISLARHIFVLLTFTRNEKNCIRYKLFAYDIAVKEPLSSSRVVKRVILVTLKRSKGSNLPPQKASLEIYEFLKRIGHTAAKLFPGYDGVTITMKEDAAFNAKK